MDLALNNLQSLMCHKIQQTNQTKFPLCVNFFSCLFNFSVSMDILMLVLDLSEWLNIVPGTNHYQ